MAIEVGLRGNLRSLIEWFRANGGEITGVYRLYSIDGETLIAEVGQDGNLHVYTDIIATGASYETHTQQLYTVNDLIICRDGAVAGMGINDLAGLIAKLYDGTNDGYLVFDKDGIARVGDAGSLQALATREDAPLDGFGIYWDAATQKFVSTKAIRKQSTTDDAAANGDKTVTLIWGDTKTLTASQTSGTITIALPAFDSGAECTSELDIPVGATVPTMVYPTGADASAVRWAWGAAPPSTLDINMRHQFTFKRYNANYIKGWYDQSAL